MLKAAWISPFNHNSMFLLQDTLVAFNLFRSRDIFLEVLQIQELSVFECLGMFKYWQ